MKRRLDTTAGLASLIVMSGCGLWVSWQLKDQIYHANPPAVFIACGVSSILSGLYGWMLSKLYLKNHNAGLLVFPIAILVLTTFSASIVYVGELLLINHKPLKELVTGIKELPEYATFYIQISGPVWLVGLTAATVVLRKIAVSNEHEN